MSDKYNISVRDERGPQVNIHERARELRESNTQIQQGRSMTAEERHRKAREEVAREIKEHAHKGGKEISYDAADRMARDIQEKAIRKG